MENQIVFEPTLEDTHQAYARHMRSRPLRSYAPFFALFAALAVLTSYFDAERTATSTLENFAPFAAFVATAAGWRLWARPGWPSASTTNRRRCIRTTR
jgi:hypothetical protein